MDLHKVIEHTILKPDCTLDNIHRLCDEAVQYNFYGVCVPPYFVRDAVRFLNEQAKVITVVGFPMGYSTIPSKVEDIKRALDEEASEIDAVVNICAIKSGNWNYVKNEVDSMMRAVSMKGRVMKLIIETGLLTKNEMKQVIGIAEANDVHFIKTSTGVNADGATVEVVKFLRENLKPKIKIKASGGIKSLEVAENLLKSGADRIGTSNGVQIALQTKNNSKI
jgi:deoxyribose-phosphate aldolase